MTAIEPQPGTLSLRAIPMAAKWRYATTTTAGDPGTGNFRMNSTSWDEVVEIYVSARDVNGDSYGTDLSGILKGTMISFLEGVVTRATFEAVEEVIPQNGGTWYAIPVQYMNGSAPKNGTQLGIEIKPQTWWSLWEPGDIAEWDITEAGQAEVWLGGDFLTAAIVVEMRRFGFGWTGVRVVSNKSPQIYYSGEIVVTKGTAAVGSSDQLLGAQRLRVTLKSIEVDLIGPRDTRRVDRAPHLNVDIAIHMSGRMPSVLPLAAGDTPVLND